MQSNTSDQSGLDTFIILTSCSVVIIIQPMINMSAHNAISISDRKIQPEYYNIGFKALI